MGAGLMGIPINRPLLDGRELDAVSDVLSSGQLTDPSRDGGGYVRLFEESVRKFTGARYAVAVSSGTSALLASLMALGVGRGSEVIVPSFTHVSTVNAVEAVGATPVYADIGPDYTIRAGEVGRLLTPRTACVIPVHLYGHAADVGAITKTAPGIPVLEDAAQALGTRNRGVHVGLDGSCGIFSFYPGKVVTSAEGGVVVTGDRLLHERLLEARNHGTDGSWGLNLRLPEVCAAIGSVQMSKLDGFLRARRRNASVLSDLLGGVADIPDGPPSQERNMALYTVGVDGRDTVLAGLMDAGVGAAVYYRTPVHAARGVSADLPRTDEAAGRVLSLPVHPTVTDADLQAMADVVRRAARLKMPQ